MIIIPERQLVVLLVPRTGSGSLRRAIEQRYPKAMMLYRHMEGDGVPHGYNHWGKIGVLRHPLERLWSLYKFMSTFNGTYDPAYISAMRKSVRVPFSEWITNNETVFTSPYDSAGLGRFWPMYTVLHPLPENRKSQWQYLRPDLGTQMFSYERIRDIELYLDILLPRHNETSKSEGMPIVSHEAQVHMFKWFEWDYRQHLRLMAQE
jgi:hypothetical protein